MVTWRRTGEVRQVVTEPQRFGCGVWKAAVWIMQEKWVNESGKSEWRELIAEDEQA